MLSTKPTSVPEYIASFPEATQKALEEVRATIRKSAPDAEELISYGMVGYKWNGVLVYFGGFKNHVGFYGTPSGHKAFENELSVYKSGKGSVQFPLDQPMPVALIGRIVEFRMQENLEKQKTKKVKKQ